MLSRRRGIQMTSCRCVCAGVAIVSVLLMLSPSIMACGLYGLSAPKSAEGVTDVRSTIMMVDPRPDLSITPSDIYVLSAGSNITYALFGQTVTVHAIVHNLGYSNATNLSVSMGVRNQSFDQGGSYNHTFSEGTYNLSAILYENSLNLNYSWDVWLTIWGEYELWALLDSQDTIDEVNETNNWITIPFTIAPLDVDVSISTDKVEYTVGDDIFFTATITYVGTLTTVPNLPRVAFLLVDILTGMEVPNTRTVSVNGSLAGTIVWLLTIPIDLTAGDYSIGMEFGGERFQSDTVIPIKEKGATFSVNVLVLAGVVVAAIACIVAGFILISKRKPKE